MKPACHAKFVPKCLTPSGSRDFERLNAQKADAGDIPFGERVACVLMLAEIVLITWLGSGTRPEFLLPMLWVSVAMFFASAFSAHGRGVPTYVKISFWCGILVVLINAVQIANPSFEYVVYERHNDLQPLAHVSWLPVSVKSDFFTGDALRSLARIVAAFSVFMSAGIIFRWKRIARLCLVFFAINATAMAAWGIFQRHAEMPIMYDAFFSISGFYGSFFLSNAAGAFINLGLAANFALVFMSARLAKASFKIAACTLFLLLAAVCVFSCYYSGSSGALGMSAVTCIVFAGASVYSLLRARFSVGASLSFVVFAAVFICVASGFALRPFIAGKPDLEKNIRISAESRMEIYAAAFETVKDNPLWGVGGDCARYYLPQTLRQHDRKNSLFVTADRAHSGFLEYLMEFGAVGFSAIAVAGIAWLFRFFREMRALGVENFVMMVGAVLFLLHSCFDMHLHIPSAMLAGAVIAVLAVSPLKGEDE